MDTINSNKTCSLEKEKQIHNGLAMISKTLSDSNFVPEQKYVDKLKLPSPTKGGGKGLFSRMERHDPSPPIGNYDIVEEAVVCIITFVIYVSLLAMLRHISWEVASNYIAVFRNNIVQNLLGGNASTIDTLEYAMESLNYELNDLVNLCISDNTLDYLTRVGYESVYYGLTGGNLCVHVFEYQVFKVRAINYIKNTTIAVIEMVSKGLTGKTLFTHLKQMVRNQYNRPSGLFTIQCSSVLDPVVRGETDLYGNYLGGKKRKILTRKGKGKSRRKLAKSKRPNKSRLQRKSKKNRRGVKKTIVKTTNKRLSLRRR